MPYCGNCLVPLSVKHLLFECLNLEKLRVRYLSRCRGADGVLRLSLILGRECLFPGYEVRRFMEEAELLREI